MREWLVRPRPLLCRSCIEACLDVWRFTCQWLCNVMRRTRSIWAVCQKQPANQSAAPKCHSPLHWRAVRPQGGQLIVASRDRNLGHGSEVCEATSPIDGLKMARGLSFGSREAKVLSARLAPRGRISANNVHWHVTAGNQSCSSQTSLTVLRFACSQRPLLRAPA